MIRYISLVVITIFITFINYLIVTNFGNSNYRLKFDNTVFKNLAKADITTGFSLFIPYQKVNTKNQVMSVQKTAVRDLSEVVNAFSTSNASGTASLRYTGGLNLPEKWIEVNLSEQNLIAWEGNAKLMEFKISSGKFNSTPKGTFRIWHKSRIQNMEGGSKEEGTYYFIPDVPFNMFFYGNIAIHGAYWHNNFGSVYSHGCINAPLKEVARLFEWSEPTLPEGKNYVSATKNNSGTKVYVHD